MIRERGGMVTELQIIDASYATSLARNELAREMKRIILIDRYKIDTLKCACGMLYIYIYNKT